jgi:hypothetical protein
MTATPDLTSASHSPASPPISTSSRCTSRRSTPTPGSRFDDHFDAINDVSRKLQRMIKALRAAQKIRAQEKEG